MFNKIDKPDPTFISRMTTQKALEYWIKLIVEGYQRLYTNQVWTKCAEVEDYNNQYHENNNPCYMFAKDLDPDTEIVGNTVSEMKEEFLKWDTEDNKWSSKLFKEAVWDRQRQGFREDQKDFHETGRHRAATRSLILFTFCSPLVHRVFFCQRR